jgi:aminoglycoside 3-N-acetyltransferase I
MTQAWTVERLGPSDLGSARELMGVFADAFEDPATYLASPCPDDVLLGRLARSDIVVLVVRDVAGTVVGGLVAYLLEKLEQARAELYIYDLAISKPHRRRGVARSLICDLQARATALGAWVVYVQADPEDAPAVALYSALGVRERVFHFDFAVSARGARGSRPWIAGV